MSIKLVNKQNLKDTNYLLIVIDRDNKIPLNCLHNQAYLQQLNLKSQIATTTKYRRKYKRLHQLKINCNYHNELKHMRNPTGHEPERLGLITY